LDPAFGSLPVTARKHREGDTHHEFEQSRPRNIEPPPVRRTHPHEPGLANSPLRCSGQAEYHGAGNQLIRVSIGDISGVSGVLDLADALPKDTDAASDEGYEKDVTIGGRSMHEKYTKAGQQSSLGVIAARRFDVEVEGTAVTMDAMHDAMSRVDLKRLESMKSQGAQK